MSRSVLIVTLPPLTGGVPVKTEILCRHLRSLGHFVTVSHYATLSDYPDLVAPAWQWVLGKKPGMREGRCFGDFPSVAVGCRFPELEFQYFRPSPFWRKLIDGHDRHIAVGGTVLASYPLVRAGVPFRDGAALEREVGPPRAAQGAGAARRCRRASPLA